MTENNKPVTDGIYAEVAGTVGRVNDGRFVLEVKSERSQYADRVTIWRPDFTVNEGDRVAVRGWISWKRNVKEDKTFFDVSLNQPKLVKHEPGSASIDENSPF